MGLFKFVSGAFRKQVVDKVGAMMDEAGKATVERARELVPVDTGQLRDSITHYYNKDTMILTIVAEKSYAAFVEFGTARGMEAQPYLRPAIAEFGRFFGGQTQAQFSNLAPKYQAKTKAYAKKLGGPKVIVGHREPRRTNHQYLGKRKQHRG